MNLEDADLLALLREGESDHVEFKESLAGSAPTAIREAICAFANDLPGHSKPGVIFVGVRDNGTITGLPITNPLLRQLVDMKDDGNIVPPTSMTVEKRNLNGQDVAIVKVLPSDSPPVRCKGAIQVRVGPRRSVATAQDERLLNERRRHGDRPFDLQPIPSSTTNDLNLAQFQIEYLPQAFAPEILEANDRSLEERLAATKMIVSVDDPTPTVLGMLVLGKNPQDFLPGAYVQFVRYGGADLSSDVLDHSTIAGSLADQLRRLDEKLDSHNRVALDITSALIERRDLTYPLAAIRQLTSNAVMHRTYEATNAPVRVHWFNDRIEILSPGGPFGIVTRESFGQPGITDYRNPNLADAMKTLGFVQRFGVGIATARRLLTQAGHPDPEFLTGDNYLSATVRLPSEE